MEKQFVILHEFNYKENESFIYFMQYTDNEENINILAEIISTAIFDNIGGDYIKFEIDCNNYVSEKTVDEIIKCNFGSYFNMFSKLTGKMENLFFLENTNMNGYEKANLLDTMFFGNKIIKLFANK
jgi:hypothetical protein